MRFGWNIQLSHWQSSRSPHDPSRSSTRNFYGGKARQFVTEDFEQFDLILAMDQDNYEQICFLDPTAQYRDKVKLMCDFCRHHTVREVPDPYYGGPEGFNYVIDLLMDACEGLLEAVIAPTQK
jgi:protein-tyrosine phosphatase